MLCLMGLNDSFAQVRCQLLLMDPIPSVNKVFALVYQKKRQKNVNINTGISGTANSMAFYVKNDAKKPNTRKSYHKYQKTKRHICTLWISRSCW